jgi:hypothetical protein
MEETMANEDDYKGYRVTVSAHTIEWHIFTRGIYRLQEAGRARKMRFRQHTRLLAHGLTSTPSNNTPQSRRTRARRRTPECPAARRSVQRAQRGDPDC